MTPSPACAAMIKAFESYAVRMPDGRCIAYPDPGTGGDPWTIGFGSTGPDIRRGVMWTREQAEQRLADDVARFSASVSHLLGSVATSQGQFDAMCSFSYNAGLHAFAESTLLRKHQEGSHAGAAAEFGKWTHGGGRILPGLVKRRAAESALYLSQGA